MSSPWAVVADERSPIHHGITYVEANGGPEHTTPRVQTCVFEDAILDPDLPLRASTSGPSAVGRSRRADDPEPALRSSG